MNTQNCGQCSVLRGQGSERAECPPLPTTHYPLPTAFTLVELLVVIVIISMLMGLLMPALIAARGRARIAQCTNNQHELSLAITQYDLAKKRLPGYLNQIKGTGMSRVGWVPMLLPFLGRNDLWADPGGWRYGYDSTTPPPTPRIDQLVCPDDADTSVPCPLTYVVNVAVYDDNPAPSPGELGLTIPSIPYVFQDYYDGSGGAISLSDIDSPSRVVMLSEKNTPILSPSRQWTETLPTGATPADREAIRGRLGFSWPNPTISALANVTVSNSLPSIHPGIVIVTFCDGHTESLSDNTLCSDYLAVP